MPENIDQFCSLIRSSFAEGTFDRLILCAPLKTPGTVSEESPRRQTLRAIELKGKLVVQWEQQFEKQQTQINLTIDESLDRFMQLFGETYRESYLFTADRELILRQTGQGTKLRSKKRMRPKPKLARQHNRSKNYLIPEGEPCQFLEALGIMTGSGRVRESRQKKFRQINRYLEIINDIYSDLPGDGPLRIVDFGCGLSYLTFAAHHLLSKFHRREVELVGIDQNPDVIERCQLLAHDLDLEGLYFSTGRIEETSQQDKFDLALSLHACDTATDAALAYSVQAEADVILAVPCCQHEAFTQVESGDLALILKHGILKERLAALATDALRAAALEAVGYKTQIMEFIDLEHTPKNLLIRAIKKSEALTSMATEYHALKQKLNLNSLSTDAIIRAASKDPSFGIQAVSAEVSD